MKKVKGAQKKVEIAESGPENRIKTIEPAFGAPRAPSGNKTVGRGGEARGANGLTAQ